jgi:hypothetical protein
MPGDLCQGTSSVSCILDVAEKFLARYKSHLRGPSVLFGELSRCGHQDSPNFSGRQCDSFRESLRITWKFEVGVCCLIASTFLFWRICNAFYENAPSAINTALEVSSHVFGVTNKQMFIIKPTNFRA